MIEVSPKTDGWLHIDMLGWSAFLGLRRSLDIPPGHVRGVRVGPPGLPTFRFGDLRTLGTSLPGVVAVGSFRMGRPWRRVFLDLRRSSREVLVLELEGWRYDCVMAEVRDAQAAVRAIEQARRAPPVPTG